MTNDIHTQPPFDYHVRVSLRARRVHLCVKPHTGLEVVVPPGFDRTKILPLLHRQSAWIRRTLIRLQCPTPQAPAPHWQLPSEITLLAIGLTWQVIGHPSDTPRLTLREVPPQSLIFTGPIHVESACRTVLHRWLIAQARTYLVPRLTAFSQHTGLEANRTTIRRQQSRWGSCTRTNNISLNANLLLLPSHIVDYVCLHELCHTIHHNHSRDFWRLLDRHCPGARRRRTELRELGRNLPAWA